MSVTFKFDVDVYVAKSERKMERGINRALDNMKDYIDSITPEDTKRLLHNNKIVKAKTKGNKIVGSVENRTPYAMFVEYGVAGRTYNYHKPKGSKFYTGVGNRTFARGLDDTKNQTLQIIKKSLGQ